MDASYGIFSTMYDNITNGLNLLNNYTIMSDLYIDYFSKDTTYHQIIIASSCLSSSSSDFAGAFMGAPIDVPVPMP